jgi:hypothetical protein
MTKPATQAERIVRIETLLEGWLQTRKEDRAEWAEMMKSLNERLDNIEAEHRKTNERLNAYENKGKGVLFAVSIAGGGLVASIITIWGKLKGVIL